MAICDGNAYICDDIQDILNKRSPTLQVETQRLASQKEYFDKNISEMERELEELIETADTTEKDAK